MTINSKKIWTVILVFGIFIAFLINISSGLDPDLGWHLKMGELISRAGIPQTDPFSYTMPSFPFVDHEWLTNVLLSKLYPILGIVGLSAFFALLAVATLFIAVPKKLGQYRQAAFVLLAGVFITFAGIRTQIFTWFFLALLITTVTDDRLWKKYRFLIPLLFLLWANMHAGFAAGLVALLVVISVRTWEQKRFNIPDWGVTIASVLATLINPYGWRLWGEVGMQLSDSSLHSSIAEWTPGIFYLDLAFLSLLALSSIFLIFRIYHKKIQPLNRLVLYSGTLLAAFSASRHIPLWGIVAAPLLAISLQDFASSLKKDPYGTRVFNKCYLGLLIISVIFFLIGAGFGFRNARRLSENVFYPKQATQFLQTQKVTGQVFAPYDWGGYLIWKDPSNKVFVDGRMPSWRRATAPTGESTWAFKDYQQIVDKSGSIQTTFDQYGVTTVLWFAPPPPESRHNFFYPLQQKYNQLISSFFPKPTNESFLDRLSSAGWQKVYQDQVAVIYQRVKN